MDFKRGDIVKHTSGGPGEKFIFWGNRKGSPGYCWLIPFNQNISEETVSNIYRTLITHSASKRCLYKKSWKEAKDWPTGFVHGKDNK
jgi:flavin-dependent dehydrogenase